MPLIQTIRPWLLAAGFSFASMAHADVLPKPEGLAVDTTGGASISWDAVDGAAAYRVAVFDQADAEGKRPLLAAVWVSGTAWTYGKAGTLPKFGKLPSTKPLPLPSGSTLRVMVAAAREEGADKSEWSGEVQGFVISGGSKRGWTSWLAAAADRRLIGTAPMVIDVLNFRPHMDQQLATWGVYSEQIADYSSKGLIKPGPETPREQKLREMMDPYSYLPVVEIPKLLIHGTNDPYWCVDATRFYWDDMVGPKYVIKLPNDGHGLENNRELALSTLAVFFRQTVVQAALPKIHWRQESAGTARQLILSTAAKPVASQLWTARSETKDFRQSRWESRPMKNGGQDYVGEWERPGSGHMAYFVELRFELDGLPYSLCSLVYWE